MTHDDIIKMAMEAGWPASLISPVVMAKLAEFALLVTAAEREACAQMAGNYAAANAESDNMAWAFLHLATAIRARREE